MPINSANEALLRPLREALEPLFQTSGNGDARRVFHGRGGLHPDLHWCAVDVFYPALIVTLYAPPPDYFISTITRLIAAFIAQYPTSSISSLALQHRYINDAPFEWKLGAAASKPVARRGDLTFNLNFNRQNVGYFLDMEPGRCWLEERIQGRSLLNLFAYTCAFSVVAKAGGAKHIVNVDMSRAVLTAGRENHHNNSFGTDNVQFLPLDILKSWSRIRKPGPYDVIIVDPPSFQKGSFVATRDYVKVIKRLPELAAADADILMCLNAPELGPDFIQDLMAEFAPMFEYQQRLTNSVDFADKDKTRQLKLLHYRLAAVV